MICRSMPRYVTGLYFGGADLGTPMSGAFGVTLWSCNFGITDNIELPSRIRVPEAS
jgi:hypothetical protein